MKTLKYLRGKLLRFIISNKIYFNLIFGVLLVLFTIFWVYNTNGGKFDIWRIDNWWGKWGDPIIGFATFLVAIIIWFSNTAKDWKESLPKKLTVIYKYQNKEVLRCEKGFLAHESDIRNWGQTIGRLIVGKDKTNRDYYFKFSRDLDVQPPIVEEIKKKFYTHYKATFFLTELPTSDELQSGIDMSKGKFLWKEGAEKAEYIKFEPIENSKKT